MTYTELAVVGVAVTAALDLVVLRTRLLRSRRFWVAYAIVLVFEVLVDGVLTGRRVVVYRGSDVIGSAASPMFGDGRVFFAPVEDLLFGFALVTQTLCWWVFWGRLGARRALAAGRGPRPRRGSGSGR